MLSSMSLYNSYPAGLTITHLGSVLGGGGGGGGGFKGSFFSSHSFAACHYTIHTLQVSPLRIWLLNLICAVYALQSVNVHMAFKSTVSAWFVCKSKALRETLCTRDCFAPGISKQ